MDEQDFINSIRAYAIVHYETSGWDELVEAWGDGDILEYYSDANGNEKKAFKEIKKTLKLRQDYACEIRSSKF
jgi:hypothetical protein